MRGFALGTMLGLSLAACAGFQYKYYGIDPATGMLLGPKPKDDIPLSLCQGDQTQKGKCVVLFIAEWERLQSDYINIQERLKACEQKISVSIE